MKSGWFFIKLKIQVLPIPRGVVLELFCIGIGSIAHNEKVFAKCGLDLTESSIQIERSKMLFQIVKLQIKSR